LSVAAACRDLGVVIRTGCAWRGRGDAGVLTSHGVIETGYLINAAGLYADRVAAAYGFGERYRILPFKGLYLHGSRAAGTLRCCVYPVPEPGMPFLGVHFTVGLDGVTRIGPTALPALWREQYGEGGALARFDGREFADVASSLGAMLTVNAPMRRLAVREAPKLSRHWLTRSAARLLRGVEHQQFRRWGPPGIRAQLYDVEARELVMDFCIEHDERSLHILNAVSPAFTCAFPFADHVVRLVSGGEAAAD